MITMNHKNREGKYMSEKKILSLLPAAFSLLMAVGTATVFRACPIKEDGTWMHCHTAQNAVVAAGAATEI